MSWSFFCITVCDVASSIEEAQYLVKKSRNCVQELYFEKYQLDEFNCEFFRTEIFPTGELKFLTFNGCNEFTTNLVGHLFLSPILSLEELTITEPQLLLQNDLKFILSRLPNLTSLSLYSEYDEVDIDGEDIISLKRLKKLTLIGMIELNNKSTTDILFNFQYTLEKLEVEQIVMERRDDICLKSLKEFKCNCRGPDPYWDLSNEGVVMDSGLFNAASSTDAQQKLTSFWSTVNEEINSVQDFKNQDLPLARIKKIMKMDEDVKMISAEAPVLFAKAAEIFINELSLRAWIHTEDNKRRTLQRNDIGMAVAKYDQFDFLIDIVPRDELKPQQKRQDAPNEMRTPTTDQVQYYFQLSNNASTSGGTMQVAQNTGTAQQHPQGGANTLVIGNQATTGISLPANGSLQPGQVMHQQQTQNITQGNTRGPNTTESNNPQLYNMATLRFNSQVPNYNRTSIDNNQYTYNPNQQLSYLQPQLSTTRCYNGVGTSVRLVLLLWFAPYQKMTLIFSKDFVEVYRKLKGKFLIRCKANKRSDGNLNFEWCVTFVRA
eukprot:sb/3463630/